MFLCFFEFFFWFLFIPGHPHATFVLHIVFSVTDCTHSIMRDRQPFPQLSRKVCCALDTETQCDELRRDDLECRAIRALNFVQVGELSSARQVLEGAVKNVRSAKRGIAGGPSGMFVEHFRPLLDSGDVIRLVSRTMAQQMSAAVESATGPFQHALSTRAGCEYVAEDASGVNTIPQGGGGEQGDPLMPLLFSLGQHSEGHSMDRS